MIEGRSMYPEISPLLLSKFMDATSKIQARVYQKIEQRCNETDDDNESDKHLQARDHRYYCLISEFTYQTFVSMKM